MAAQWAKFYTWKRLGAQNQKNRPALPMKPKKPLPWPLGPGPRPQFSLAYVFSQLSKAGVRITPKNRAAYHDLKREYEKRLKESKP